MPQTSFIESRCSQLPGCYRQDGEHDCECLVTLEEHEAERVRAEQEAADPSAVIADPSPGRKCAWCRGPLDRRQRRDAETCSKSCRQSRHRFRVSRGPELPAGAAPMRFRYLDPPYPDKAFYYEDHPDFGGEVDHKLMIERACDESPDGWALSTSGESMGLVLRLCPPDVRTSIWVKGSRAGVSHRPRSAFEPVIIWRGRARRMEVDEDLDDVLIWGGRQPSHPGALVGMKSACFAEWMFRQLGACVGDSLVDVFTGSGAIARAWSLYAGDGDMSRHVQLGMFEPEKKYAQRTALPSRLQEATARAAALIAASETEDSPSGE